MNFLQKPRALWDLVHYLRDGEVALWRKLVGVTAVVYLVVPFDLIPDFIPVIGWLDDAGVLAAAAWFMVREVRRHRARAQAWPQAVSGEVVEAQAVRTRG